MKIAILGTRGIPNHYGGFEQFAEYLAKHLVQRGHQVVVYNGHTHPYKEVKWNGVDIIHKYDPEYRLGSMGQFIYDLTCILDTRKREFDIILQLGYTSSSIWGWLLPKKAKIITNMDGLEWKRTKYTRQVQKFLLYAEKLAVRFSDFLVSDSIGIQTYLAEKYNVKSTYIPYGADVIETFSADILEDYNLDPFLYNMLIARLEPENSIEVILDGVSESTAIMPFLVVGNYNSKYGSFLREKYSGEARILFLGGIYDIEKLNNLRYFCNLYFHGHTVGGTNPSLLEAMGSGGFICANDNIFNKSILGEHAKYFSSREDVASLLDEDHSSLRSLFVNTNMAKIKDTFSWHKIVGQYEELFEEAHSTK